jgi:hypothetical protein
MRRVVSTMAPTKREKAFCVLEFAKSGSVITLQRRFRTRYGKDPPGPNSIKHFHTKGLRPVLCGRHGECQRIPGHGSTVADASTAGGFGQLCFPAGRGTTPLWPGSS